MLEIFLFLIAVAVIGFIVIVAKQPADFRITRKDLIAAPAAAVFAEVNDLRKWSGWSPWAKLDPEAKNSFEGPASGTGAIMRWAGNSKVGEGSMIIVDSRPDEFIQFTLEFLKPFKATNTAEFVFTPEGAQTAVSWSMYGTNNFAAKAMGLVINCDKMVGGQFEKGLASLKSIVEVADKA